MRRKFTRLEIMTIIARRVGLAVCLFLLAQSVQAAAVRGWQSGLVVLLPDSRMGADAEVEFKLASLFARHLHVRLKPVFLPPEQLAAALQAHSGHFAAGLRQDKSQHRRYGPVYRKRHEQLVCAALQPASLSELNGTGLVVGAGTTQASALRAAEHHLPTLSWSARSLVPASVLLEQVAQGALDCTVADDDALAAARNYYPSLKAGLDLGTSSLAWAFPKNADPALLAQAKRFFADLQTSGALARLLDDAYSYQQRLSEQEAAEFLEKTQQALPQYRHLFEQAAELTGQDWRLLAAIAYHESHWEPEATSRTKVRGMMMLTESTARRMNVRDRLDARQSIVAGARYFKFISAQLTPDITGTDRTWFALAAYNQGIAHLSDARTLARQLKYNPSSWADVRQTLPLLAQPKYFKRAKFGRARGGEAVIMVEKIRLYQEMLRHLQPDPPPAQPQPRSAWKRLTGRKPAPH